MISYNIKSYIFSFHSLQICQSKIAFQQETHNDVVIHEPKSENGVPLAFQEYGHVVASNVEGHLHIRLPYNQVNDSVSKENLKHEEALKNNNGTGIETYHPCENECKMNENGIYKCTTLDYYKTEQECEPYSESDAMKMEKSNLEILNEMLKLFFFLMKEAVFINKRSIMAIILIVAVIGGAIASIAGPAYNAMQISELQSDTAYQKENDIIVSKSLNRIYAFENETSSNFNRLENITEKLLLAETKIERHLAYLEHDKLKRVHAEKTYKLLKKEIKALTNVFETAMHGKLSTDIVLIYNLEEAYTNFISDAKEKGYIVPAGAFNHLFQLDVTFYVDKETNSINLIVHIPLMRQEKSLIMHKYVGTAIPINSQYGMILENYHDIIAYNDEEYVTLSSKELWKCQKLANVYFCRDIIGKSNF